MLHKRILHISMMTTIIIQLLPPGNAPRTPPFTCQVVTLIMLSPSKFFLSNSRNQCLKFLFISFYDISNCGGSPVNYDSLVNNQCVALSDTESIKAVYPEFYFYASKDCTGPEESFPYFVGSTCTATDFSTGRKLVETEAAMPTYYDVFPMGYYTTSAEVQVQASATAEVSSGSSVAATDASSIAGIVIGVVLGFGLVGAALYYMLRRNGKAGEEEAVPLNEK